jgi:predicted RNase H-like HicB family nuclease
LDENLVESYNKIINECIDGVREFLTIHYFASDRSDTPFWRATKHVTPPDSLRDRMEVIELPGVLAYGETHEVALSRVQALALRVIAERLEHGEAGHELLSISFNAV